MSRCSEHHLTLDAEGRGKCSVPMWGGSGGPAGFCDAPAFGEPPPSLMVWSSAQQMTVRADGRYPGYVPGLACPGHGGPDTRVFRDGDAWCAVRSDFIDLQTSPAGFGASPDAARSALLAVTP